MIFDNIQTICKEKGMKIAELEREAGLANGAISKWRTSSPTVDNLKSVARVLKVKLERLLED